MEWIVQLYWRFNRRIGEDDAIHPLEKRGVAETTVQTTSMEGESLQMADGEFYNHLQTLSQENPRGGIDAEESIVEGIGKEIPCW